MDIPIRKPCVVCEDKTAAIKISNDVTAIKHTKHTDVRHHFSREHVDQGTVTMVQVATKDQLADAMTKVLGKEIFLRLREYITSDVDLTSVDTRPKGST